MKKETNPNPEALKRPPPPPAPPAKDQFGFSWLSSDIETGTLSHTMKNEELQDCIISTNAMLKTCEKNERHDVLFKHFEALLELQKHRASLAKINYT